MEINARTKALLQPLKKALNEIRGAPDYDPAAPLDRRQTYRLNAVLQGNLRLPPSKAALIIDYLDARSGEASLQISDAEWNRLLGGSGGLALSSRGNEALFTQKDTLSYLGLLAEQGQTLAQDAAGRPRPARMPESTAAAADYSKLDDFNHPASVLRNVVREYRETLATRTAEQRRRPAITHTNLGDEAYQIDLKLSGAQTRRMDRALQALGMSEASHRQHFTDLLALKLHRQEDPLQFSDRELEKFQRDTNAGFAISAQDMRAMGFAVSRNFDALRDAFTPARYAFARPEAKSADGPTAAPASRYPIVSTYPASVAVSLENGRTEASTVQVSVTRATVMLTIETSSGEKRTYDISSAPPYKEVERNWPGWPEKHPALRSVFSNPEAGAWIGSQIGPCQNLNTINTWSNYFSMYITKAPM